MTFPLELNDAYPYIPEGHLVTQFPDGSMYPSLQAVILVGGGFAPAVKEISHLATPGYARLS